MKYIIHFVDGSMITVDESAYNQIREHVVKGEDKFLFGQGFAFNLQNITFIVQQDKTLSSSGKIAESQSADLGSTPNSVT